jgi:hypothetical protein
VAFAFSYFVDRFMLALQPISVVVRRQECACFRAGKEKRREDEPTKTSENRQRDHDGSGAAAANAVSLKTGTTRLGTGKSRECNG